MRWYFQFVESVIERTLGAVSASRAGVTKKVHSPSGSSVSGLKRAWMARCADGQHALQGRSLLDQVAKASS